MSDFFAIKKYRTIFDKIVKKTMGYFSTSFSERLWISVHKNITQFPIHHSMCGKPNEANIFDIYIQQIK